MNDEINLANGCETSCFSRLSGVALAKSGPSQRLKYGNCKKPLKRFISKHLGNMTLSRLESKNINPENAKQEVDLIEAFSGFWIDLFKVQEIST